MNLNINFSEKLGAMKPMHAVNNAPVHPMRTQCRGNFDTFKALKIPYARTHDASLSEIYGSQHVMDVHCIFTDFSRDPDDPTAYDFINTDFCCNGMIMPDHEPKPQMWEWKKIAQPLQVTVKDALIVHIKDDFPVGNQQHARLIPVKIRCQHKIMHLDAQRQRFVD